MVTRPKLLDTNILIDCLRGYGPTVAYLEALKKSKVSLYISTVTQLEIYAGQSSRSADIKRRIEKLLKSYKELAIDGKVATQAGILKRDFGITALDAIIASTALQYKLTLVTRNTRHFDRVPNIRLEQPII